MDYWKTLVRLMGAGAFVVIVNIPLASQQTPVQTSHTQIVLLGTGNPAADPDRSGPATAIVVNGTPSWRPAVDAVRSTPAELLNERPPAIPDMWLLAGIWMSTD